MGADRVASIAFLAVLLGVALVILAGCGTTVEVKCPAIRAYSLEFQRAAADQLETLPEGSPVVRMVRDYRELRKAIRACAG